MTFTYIILTACVITLPIWAIFYYYDTLSQKNNNKSSFYESPFKKNVKTIDNRVKVSADNHMKNTSDIIGKTLVVEELDMDNFDFMASQSDDNDDNKSSSSQSYPEDEQDDTEISSTQQIDEDTYGVNDEEEHSHQMEQNDVEQAILSFTHTINHDGDSHYKFPVEGASVMEYDSAPDWI